VRREQSGRRLHVGDTWLRRESDLLGTVAKATGVDFVTASGSTNAVSQPVRQLRVAMYQRYNGGNMDEGWTRLLFEDFGQPYQSIHPNCGGNLITAT
jgi:hypothetical protein